MADDGLQVYFAKFGLDASEFLGGLEKSSGGILKFYRDVSVSLGATMFVFDKLMAYGEKFITLANQATEFQSAIDKLTVTTGMSTTELYKWSNVARYADSDISSLSAMLRKLSINMKDTGTAGDEARAMLNGMHVSMKNADGSARSMNDIFPDVIEGLKGIEDTGTRNTVAMTLFGRSFQELSGYMLMSKSEMQGYFDKGFAPTSEQEQKLRDYEQALKDLNTTTGKVATEGGMALSGSLKEWTQLMNDAFNDDSPIISFFETLDGFLTLAARGFHILGSEALAAYQVTQFNFSGAKTTLEDLNTWVQNKARDDRLRAAGFRTDGNGNVVADEKKTGSSDFVLPDDKEKEKVLTAEQIVSKQTELARKTIEANRAEREYQELKKKTNDWQSTGVKTQLEFNENLELARLRAIGLKNECAGITAELKAAGVAAAAVAGGPTYNSMYASSLNTGGVGPDTAGFSDLAGMSQSELEKIAAGGLGKSKAMAERAQQYLSMMKSGKSPSGATSPAVATKDPQIKALETLTSATETEYQKQTDAFQKHLDALATLRAERYPALETQDLTHWATNEEIAKTAIQKELDFMAAAVNFGGTNPIVQNYIVMSRNGPDWTPPAFQAVTAPKLESADFTQVGAAVQGIVAKGLGGGTSGSVTINQTNNIVTPDSDKAANKVAKATSRVLAGVNGVGGQL